MVFQSHLSLNSVRYAFLHASEVARAGDNVEVRSKLGPATCSNFDSPGHKSASKSASFAREIFYSVEIMFEVRSTIVLGSYE